jgi:hypothetical protein
VLGADGNPLLTEVQSWRARFPESHKIWSYAATMDFLPRPEHKLSLSIMGTPGFNNQLRTFNGYEAVANPLWSQEALTKTNTDVILHWTSRLMERRWQIDAVAGLHNEYFYNHSPFADVDGRNQLEIYGLGLNALEGGPADCAPTASGFDPCPVNPYYHTGGFGLVRKYSGNRWMGELKSTHQVEGGGHHEIKYGYHLELATLSQDRWYTGPLGQRALVQLTPGGMPNFNTYSFFTVQPGEFPTDFGTTRPFTDLLYRPDYQDNLKADVKSLSHAFFLQDGFSPDPLRNLTINVGARLELQRLYDTHGSPFLDATNLGPRLGAVYDPLNDGRSKISVSYGRYFEAIPLNLAARYFGGEGIYIRSGVPIDSTCTNPDPLSWTGNGEWHGCPIPAKGDTMAMDTAAGGSQTFNNGSNYPVQSHLKGQFHNEVVATVEREIVEDLTIRLDYIHRWLGNIIEDGGDSNGFFVLANPGNVPKEALDDAQKDIDRFQAQVNTLGPQAMADPMNAGLQAQLGYAQSALGNAQGKLQTLQELAKAPKPERTYDAISLSLNKRFSKNWFARASYTYSRLIGNYEGLYQTEQNYFAPNGNNFHDTSDLYWNIRGPLPNDRPHLGRLDGYYTHALGKGNITAGLSFVGQSGMPRNYMSALLPAQQIVFLLPRGAAGRTPTITQFDGHLAYGRELSPKVMLEAFVDLFNQQAALLTDDNYTFDLAASIVNGTPNDLKFAKNAFGAPIAKNANFGHALTYQQPFHGRLGLRLTF